MKAILRTEDRLAPLILRIALGAVMLPHGLQKTLGLFGGHGFTATMDSFAAQGLPAAIAFLVILAESAGSLGLLAGFLTRFCALGIGAVMTGAIAIVHWQHGFFMNWSGQKAGEGFEFHVLALGIALALLVAGGGKASVDAVIAPRLGR